MRILGINGVMNQRTINYNKQQNNNVSPSFKSICADATPANQLLYAIYTDGNKEFSKIKNSSTRIFRELSSEIAVSKLIKPNDKTEIKILGSSDGSEAWGHAIAVKEHNPKAASNVKIKGIDIQPYMTDIANTGCIVMSDIERIYADKTGNDSMDRSPIKGKGWHKYLKKTKRPEAFNETLDKYPFTKYMEFDPAAKKMIGSGLNWYEINKEGLPEVTFETGDMRTSLTPSKDSDSEVYVMANSAVYLFEKNPNDFLKMFKDIKEETKDKKDVYVVLGTMEDSLIHTPALGLPHNARNHINTYIDFLGFKQMSEKDVRKLGIKNSEDVSHKIYKLEKSKSAE